MKPSPPARDAAEEADLLAEHVLAERDRLAGQLPDIDPGELFHILLSILRPFGSGKRWLLYRDRDERHVF